MVKELATVVGRWGFARLFAECIDKIHFNSSKQTADEQAFEQLVSRYEAFLRATSNPDHKKLGIMIHDNNQTVRVLVQKQCIVRAGLRIPTRLDWTVLDS